MSGRGPIAADCNEMLIRVSPDRAAAARQIAGGMRVARQGGTDA
jgi:hypothetical protein